MTDDQAQEAVLEAILSATKGNSDDHAASLSALPENLLTIVDSFGFVQLVAAIEERLGVELDLDGVDLGDLVIPTSLVSFLQNQTQA